MRNTAHLMLVGIKNDKFPGIRPVILSDNRTWWQNWESDKPLIVNSDIWIKTETDVQENKKTHCEYSAENKTIKHDIGGMLQWDI